MSEFTVKDLLAAGVHFGHQTQKWNPKMKPYVYGEKNGIYIIDLFKTVLMAKKAYEFLYKVSSQGKPILFVGTKRQASEIMKKAAQDCGAFYVTHRWLGGMLTNFKTISLSIDKLRKVERMKENGDFKLLTKKEQAKIDKDVAKLERNLGGIKNMRKLPGAVVIVDPNTEKTAVKEANILGIPVIAVTDTNCDPTGIDFIVPANDDAIKSIKAFTSYFAQSIGEGAQTARKAKENEGERDISLEKEILSKYEQDLDLQAPSEKVEVKEKAKEEAKENEGSGPEGEEKVEAKK
ncbi:MAG: 30S ribosomal protein S2 [Bacteriovoracales bacterium]|nr:30S ribosomal protein S2 [Bacteriovoracales bacterium]